MAPNAIISLVVVGVVLILAEIFVPGGVVGSVGALFLIIGVISGFFLSPALGFGLLIGALVFGLIAFWLWMKFFPRTSMGRRIILSRDARDWDGFDAAQGELVGKEGISRCPLHPSGIAVIEGKRVDVVSRGELIAADRPIQVIEVEGNRVVVKEVMAKEAE